jgi:glycosyltransferase involved in cell wall biosynthesis
MRIGIDASNLGLGGGMTHIKELLHYVATHNEWVGSIVVFASQRVLDQLPTSAAIEKVTFPELNGGLLKRFLFQLVNYDKGISANKCDIIFSITGDYLGKIRPVVGMSRNLLLYDRFIWKDFRQFRELVRTYLNYRKQRFSFKNSSGIIFISEHARKVIKDFISLDGKQTTLIHHGISSRFSAEPKPQLAITEYSLDRPFRLLYVSTVHIYKHQWNVVEAVAELRAKGYPLELHLAGAVIFKPAGKRLRNSVLKYDPTGEFVRDHGWVSYETIDSLYKSADAFVYASDCENMPNILIEAMSAGLPILCSDRYPMPEFAGEYAYYFKSRQPATIAEAIERMLCDPERRAWKAGRSKQASEIYSWTKTSEQTFRFLNEIYKANR